MDTNALLMVFQFGINLEHELNRLLGTYEVLVPSPVLSELKSICAPEAKLACKFASRYRVLEGKGKPDQSVFELAKERRAVVLTNDKELIRRLRAEKIPLIFLKSKTHLVVEGIG